jgi:Protein of unknown function (DUF3105)
VALSTVVVLFVTTVVLVYLHRLNPDERRLLAGAAAAARSAGCTDVRTTGPYPGGLDRAHVGVGGPVPTLPSLATYPSKPPASGPHASSTVGAGVYPDPPPIADAIHSLEHGAAIVWLAPDALSDSQVEPIESFFRRGNEKNHVIVAPFDYPDQGAEGSLPPGKRMALVAWHRLQLCDRPSLAVAFSFVERYRFNLWRRGSYRGDAPEKYSPI